MRLSVRAFSGEVVTGSPQKMRQKSKYLEHVPIPFERDML